MNSSVWVVEGQDQTYFGDGNEVVIVGVASTSELADKLVEQAEERNLAYTFIIYEMEVDTLLPFEESDSDEGNRLMGRTRR